MSLTIITGSMFAGKSTFLVEKIKEIMNNCNVDKILCLSHSMDNRYHNSNNNKGKIITHNQNFVESINITNLNDILNYKDFPYCQYIFIDEAQFFDDLEDFVNFCIKLGKYVYVAGLRIGLDRLSLGKINNLIHIADKVHYLYAKCDICNLDNAVYNVLKFSIDFNDPTAFIGGKEKYYVCCEKCCDLCPKI